MDSRAGSDAETFELTSTLSNRRCHNSHARNTALGHSRAHSALAGGWSGPDPGSGREGDGSRPAATFETAFLERHHLRFHYRDAKAPARIAPSNPTPSRSCRRSGIWWPGTRRATISVIFAWIGSAEPRSISAPPSSGGTCPARITFARFATYLADPRRSASSHQSWPGHACVFTPADRSGRMASKYFCASPTILAVHQRA